MPRASLLPILALVVVAVSACSDDGGTPPADAPAVVDAPVDSGFDAATVDRCQFLCECMVGNCGEEMAACLTTCAELASITRECRIEHCGLAAFDPTRHCPHARGEPVPDTPPECLQP